MLYRTPGVYVEEIGMFPMSVKSVESNIPVFIGYTEKAEKDGLNLTLIPTTLSSRLEFEELFGEAKSETGISAIVTDSIISSGTSRTVEVQLQNPNPFILSYALRMFFANGGHQCYVVSVGQYGIDATPKASQVETTHLEAGLATINQIDEPTLIVFPDATSLNSKVDFYNLYNHALNQCQQRRDRFTIIDTYSSTNLNNDITELRNTIVADREFLKYGAAYYPYLKTNYGYQFTEDDIIIKHHLKAADGTLTDGALDELTLDDIAGEEPILHSEILAKITELKIILPPSAAMAGIYARIDKQRGVWKAPANVSVLDVIGPSILISTAEQEGLNVDAVAGKSVNAIRVFTGKGTLVWGARTLAGNDNEWRYVSVVRFFIMIEESIKRATEAFVFEPNDANTWVKIKAMIENYLTIYWRSGALAGAKTDEAFFANVGLGETMTAADILDGLLIVEIGMAVVRPAEFVILRISHKMQE